MNAESEITILSVDNLPDPDSEDLGRRIRSATFGPVTAYAWSDGERSELTPDRYISHAHMPGTLDASEAEELGLRFLAAARWLRGQGGVS